VIPPAAISGIFFTTFRTSGNSSRSGRSVPRCPPASFASTTTAAAPSRSASFPNSGEETMETMGTSYSFPTLKMSREKPAPVTIMSTPASMDALTASVNCLMANMMFTAITPPVIRFALRMSSWSWSTGIPDPPIVPMPPHSATAAASDDVDTRTDIPPCTMGILAVNRPIFNSGSFTFPPPGRSNDGVF